MKNILIIAVIVLFVLAIYVYVRARFIWRKLSFNVEVKRIDLRNIEEIGVSVNFVIRNNSDFNIKLKNARITVRGKDGNVIAYSSKINKVEILAYQVVKVPLNVKINTVEMLTLISEPYLKYEIKAYYKQIPLSYSDIIEKI